ncbi:MAG: isocitrate lyase, partial [Anaerolineae bacterium]
MNPQEVKELEQVWQTNSRWRGVTRPYNAEDVLRLRGSVKIEHT